MMEVKDVVCAQEWAEQTYGAAQLGHVARTRRAVVIAAAMAAEPAGSVPAQQHSQAATKAVYRFCENAHVSYEALMQPHWQQTRTDASRYQQVLLVQDTTQVDYQAHPKTTGLGPIGNGTHQGFLLQSVLAIEPMSHEVLGVLQQEPFLRQPAPKQERSQQRAQRAHEAQVWERAVAAIGSPPAGVQWIHVGDRGSDDFAFMRACEATRTHFLIRVAQDRLVDEEVQRGQEAVKPRPHRTRRPEEQQPEPLKTVVARWPVRGAQVVDVPPEHERQARTAQLSLSWGQVRLHPPQESKDPDRRPIVVWVLHVWEAQPPEGVEALEWYLLTSVPTESESEAWQRVQWYRQRWTVEDYHHGLKTGCRIEARQLQSYEGLRRLLGFLAPVAVRLLQVRWHARQTPDQPAVQVLPRMLVHLVALKTGGSVEEMTIEQCWKKIAQLGGYLGRKSDGPPGWKTLWHGWLHLQDLLEGAQLAIQLSLDEYSCG